MFLLSTDNEILILGADLNPCAVLDIWSSKTFGEHISCIVAFEGKTDEESQLFTFLIGGTYSGLICFYNIRGVIVESHQV
jgi:hypothetical protein